MCNSSDNDNGMSTASSSPPDCPTSFANAIWHFYQASQRGVFGMNAAQRKGDTLQLLLVFVRAFIREALHSFLRERCYRDHADQIARYRQTYRNAAGSATGRWGGTSTRLPAL